MSAALSCNSADGTTVPLLHLHTCWTTSGRQHTISYMGLSSTWDDIANAIIIYFGNVETYIRAVKTSLNKLLKAIIKHDRKTAMELSVALTEQLYLCTFDCTGLNMFLVIECKDVIIVCDGLKQEIEELIMGECMIWQDSEWAMYSIWSITIALLAVHCCLCVHVCVKRMMGE